MPGFGPTSTVLSGAGGTVSPLAPALPLFTLQATADRPPPGSTEALTQAVRAPAAPVSYMGLGTGPEMAFAYEPNSTIASGTLGGVTTQSGAPESLPLEGSDALLRTLSPFMIQLEPPLVYGDSGIFGSPDATNQINVNTYTNGSATTQGYSAARTALAQSGLASANRSVVSPEAYILSNDSTTSQRPSNTDPPTDPGNGRLGKPGISDFLQAVDIARQLSIIVNAPPLVLLINPESMKTSYQKIQQFQDRTRNGLVFQAHGEDQTKISISAKCGAFISGGRGVSYASKRDSAAWQNLMNAFTFFKNNGYIFDTLGKSNANLFVGALSIHYDGVIYYGHIDTFSWTYDEKAQLGGITFQMEFVANAIIDTAQPTTVVLPMSSPIQNPVGGPAPAPASNEPGVFSVGLGSNGQPLLATQGRQVNVGSALQTLVPGAIAQAVPGSQASPTNIGAPLQSSGPGMGGFQPPTPDQLALPGQRAVYVANPQSVSPFGGF